MPSRRLATPCRGGNLNLPLQVTSLLLPSLSSLPEPYQCATVVLQCSCSSLPLQCSQSPVSCFLPACQSPFPIPACTPSTSLPSPPLLQPHRRVGPLFISQPPSLPTNPDASSLCHVTMWIRHLDSSPAYDHVDSSCDLALPGISSFGLVMWTRQKAARPEINPYQPLLNQLRFPPTIQWVSSRKGPIRTSVQPSRLRNVC